MQGARSFLYISRLFIIAMIGFLLVWSIPASISHAIELKPYKDRIFKYRKPIEVLDGGDFLRLPYDVLRDINKRDELPVRKVRGFYVSSKPKRHEQDLVLSANGRQITHFAVGQLAGNASMTVIFLHGRDGSRHLGFDDDRFGGNFNRVKNLMFRNNGIYISTDFADFEETGKQDVAALVERYRSLTKGPVVVACGSMGTFLCWRLAKDPKASAMIDGYVIMGGFSDPEYLTDGKVRVPKSKAPIYFAHGSIDSVYSWKDTYRFYQALRKAHPGYPVRFALFDTGKHGTPVRMIDWRVALNWIASLRQR